MSLKPFNKGFCTIFSFLLETLDKHYYFHSKESFSVVEQKYSNTHIQQAAFILSKSSPYCSFQLLLSKDIYTVDQAPSEMVS